MNIARRLAAKGIPLAAALLLMALVPSAGNGGTPLNAETTAAVRSADLVVVARVTGLVDEKPQAQSRRGREVHRVTVTATLKGGEATGDALLVRPNGNEWRDGETYVMFLHRGADRFVRAISTPPLLATQTTLAALRAAVADAGGGVMPRTAILAESYPGWDTQPTSVLLVREDLTFEGHTKDGAGALIPVRGRVTPADLTALRRAIEAAPPGIKADDGGLLKVRWRDASGAVRHAEFDLVQGNPGSHIELMLRQFTRPGNP